MATSRVGEGGVWRCGKQPPSGNGTLIRHERRMCAAMAGNYGTAAKRGSATVPSGRAPGAPARISLHETPLLIGVSETCDRVANPLKPRRCLASFASSMDALAPPSVFTFRRSSGIFGKIAITSIATSRNRFEVCFPPSSRRGSGARTPKGAASIAGCHASRDGGCRFKMLSKERKAAPQPIARPT